MPGWYRDGPGGIGTGGTQGAGWYLVRPGYVPVPFPGLALYLVLAGSVPGPSLSLYLALAWLCVLGPSRALCTGS